MLILSPEFRCSGGRRWGSRTGGALPMSSAGTPSSGRDRRIARRSKSIIRSWRESRRTEQARRGLKNQNARCLDQEASVRIVAAWRPGAEPLEAARMVTGDLLDVGPRNAQVVELTVVESGKLTHGLLVGGPLLESLTNTHFHFSFFGDAS